MITDYSTLKTAVASHLHRGDLTSVIPEFIAAGETRIYDEIRIMALETAYTGTTAAATLPTGYLDWKWLYLDTNPRTKLDRKDVEWIIAKYGSDTGTPACFARNASSIIFGPTPDTTYNLVGCYYKRLTALSDSNTSNWLITDAPQLILNAALVEAVQYTQDDDRLQIFEARYQQAKVRLERADKKEALSGSRLTTIRG